MKNKNKAGTRSALKEVLLGIVVGTVVSVVLCAALSYLIIQGKTEEMTATILVMGIQYIAASLCALFAGKRVGNKYAVVCGCAAGGYLLLLFASSILFFGSSFHRVGIGCIMCVAGFVTACAMCMIKKRSSHRRK